ANQNYSTAQNRIRYTYDNVFDVTENATEPEKWYRKSAVQENAVVQSILSYCYLYERGVTKITKWHGKNNAVAQNRLGCIYNEGFGVSTNFTKAVKWYQTAANSGNV
ncbi:hypothetical protein K501DRAFT_157980, partial [Backusella circina FSU 941]